ncbi:FUSC family protein [Microbacterium sp. X-17]|uniref:FUSC family protein n=1 Tax=Microbacterium sp. X-17 TaxID=3144404 RepID=UPI0031F5CE56
MDATRRMIRSFQAPERGPLLQVLKSAVSVAASWLVALVVIPGGPPPVFAAIAALLVVQPSVNQSLTKGLERTVGVVAGVGVASLLGLLFGEGTWVVLTAATVGLLLAWVFRMTPGSANQIAISAVLVLAMAPITPDYAIDRLVETFVGAIIGFLVNLAIVPPVALAPAHAKLQAFTDELAAAFDRLADALQTPLTADERVRLLARARTLHGLVQEAADAIAAGRDSLALNPRARRHREELAGLTRLCTLLTPIVTQLVGMTRAVTDRYDDTLRADPAVRELAEHLRRAGHDVRTTGARVEAPGSAAAIEPAALTTPLSIADPPRHWVLVGALMEDLRRIHENLATV